MGRIISLGCVGMLLLAAVPGHAQAPPEAGIGSRGEEWLGEGSDLGLELAHVIAEGKKGNVGQARRDLESIAAEAEARELKVVWIRAQQAWVRFTRIDQPALDPAPALEELLRRARGWELESEEAEIFALWSEVFEEQGQWMMALKSQDRVTQLALASGRVSRAVEAFLDMSELCRKVRHSWRLQQIWVRLDQVLASRPAAFSGDLTDRIAAERTASAGLLSPLPKSGAPQSGVDMQPLDSRILVSVPDRELGRSRFLLTNTSVFPVEGLLKLTTGRSSVMSWQTSGEAHFISLGAEGNEPADRPVKLRPGQQMEVFVEHDPASGQEKVSVNWLPTSKTGSLPAEPGGTVTASATFYFSEGLPDSSVINAGVFEINGGWSIPIYHEIYHRGRGTILHNLQIAASAPCRLEIHDHDTGRLLAVDADGDGKYNGPGDQLMEDADRDGQPDLIVGERARGIEIYAWPLGTSGSGITVKAGLRGSAGGGVENVLRTGSGT